MKLSNCQMVVFSLPVLFIFCCAEPGFNKSEIIDIDKDWIIKDAQKYLSEKPETVTDSFCTRSQGGIHDFYSEGDYWWPDTMNTDGPYIRRDGMTNPDNFVQHRLAMRRMSIQVATLTSAYLITDIKAYALKAIEHLSAWFINEETRMNPSMKFSQAIKGVTPGRGIGIIDAIHLVEPVRAVVVLKNSGELTENDFKIIKMWFIDFLSWLTTHPYGIEERETKNNHSTCWVMQVAAYASFTGNDSLLLYCTERFKNVLLPVQVAEDGSFPLELQRTKPYGYSLFNLDAMAMICQILSDEDNNLWVYETGSGVSMVKALQFMYPYILDKKQWPYHQDIMYWDEWPVRHPALLFSGIALNKSSYINLWKTLPPLPESNEGIRNFPIRLPLLWFD